MLPSSLFRLDLRRLILLLAVVSAAAALLNTFYASYYVQREVLIGNTLEANRVYASKLAASIESFFKTAQQQLAYSATNLTGSFHDEARLQSEVDRLLLQTDSFNSVFVASSEGVIRASAPNMDASQLANVLAGTGEMLHEQRPMISKPYIVDSAHTLVFVSQPILAEDQGYLGYIAAVIRLEHQNILSFLIGEHYYRDGSYLYVVDQDGRLIHHIDPTWLGQVISDNPAIDAVMRGKAGSTRLVNSRGIDMLAGYAPVSLPGWGVIAQRPTVATLAELDGLMMAILRHALPWAMAGLLCIYLLARLISQPLWQLARGARHIDSDDAVKQIREVQSWYFEAAQLKRAMLAGIGSLHQRIGTLNRDVLTDPLTGLYNRRGLSVTLDTWQVRQQVFSIVALDIDHFKNINDLYGHDIGDQVIKHVAQLMRESSRSGDVLCRHGGEEFLMLLPGVCLDDARLVAERLRLRMQMAEMPSIDTTVTISLGVAQWRPLSDDSVEQALKMADQALYSAKQQGRNQVVVARRRSSGTEEQQCD